MPSKLLKIQINAYFIYFGYKNFTINSLEFGYVTGVCSCKSCMGSIIMSLGDLIDDSPGDRNHFYVIKRFNNY